MQDKQQEQMEKLAKLLSGNATEQERAAAKGEGGEEWDKAKKLWDKTGAMDNWEPDVDKAWQRFSIKAMAREQQMPAADRPIAPAGNTIQPQGRERQLQTTSSLRWWLASAAAVMLLLLGVWVVRQTPAEAEIMKVATAANEKQEVLLPDGSKVWLNENSILTYAKSFSVDDRRVELSGEAFFEVQKAEGKRFTILAGGTITEVIGTSFNVNAYSQQPVTVQVVTGRVAFADAQKEEAVFLGPGEQATFGGNVAGAAAAEVQRQEISNPNFRAWQNGELQFANTSLEQLSHTLSDYFDQEVVLQDPALSNCRFTATFENPSLEEVLEVLRLTGNFTITQTQKGYLISGQGCQ
ncbi:FecR family protein [Cesiribacter sp. SM1]|uniref:FecR family protein n=1 Tax=Cesiribacter sp. SM1 TaxID=2861196 RepID=UPI001CD1CE79|nr:FecR domain-containing protein [Cesiribacter sp. SM1]